MSGEIEVFTFERDNSSEDTYTTQDPTEAKERGQRYGLRVIANTYEWTDSEVAWDFTTEDED